MAKELTKFGVINIGAVGTFVVRKDVGESVLRAAIVRTLPFKCEIMICPAQAIVDLASSDPFSGQPSGRDITRFVMVLHKPLQSSFVLPISSHVTRHSSLCLPSANKWLLKIIAIQNRFVLGLYRREMKAIGYLGKIENQLGVAATTRNWNTIQKVVQVLQEKS